LRRSETIEAQLALGSGSFPLCAPLPQGNERAICVASAGLVVGRLG